MIEGLKLSGITHSYGGQVVVRDLDLNVEPGELVCLLGPSGCGKTTTLRIAAGLEHPSTGSVHLNGQLVSGPAIHLPPEARGIGFLFQDYALFPHLNVQDNVLFGLSALPKADRADRARDMLAQVGMQDYAKAWPHQLSGGQQQRVALARALAPNPRLILLDEPFSGLDKRLRDQVRDETLHVLKANQVAALMVTHDPEEAMFMADRIAVMQGGRIVQLDSPHGLYNHPNNPFVASFFGEVNIIPAIAGQGVAKTVLGDFACPHLEDGDPAEVMIRPEAITIREQADGAATVLDSRLLGRTSLVHLKVGDHHLHARLACRSLPPRGGRLTLSIDPAQSFVFHQDA